MWQEITPSRLVKLVSWNLIIRRVKGSKSVKIR